MELSTHYGSTATNQTNIMPNNKRPFLNNPIVYTSKYLYWQTLDFLDAIVKENPHFKAALDVPTGGGAIAKYMAENLGLTVHASDIDALKYQYHAPFEVADLGRQLPYPDESFDITVCMEGLKHVTDINTAVKELARVTKKGGYIIITIPNDLTLQNRFRYFFDGFVDCDWRHPVFPDDKNVKEHLYGMSLTNLPHLYFNLVVNKLELVRTATSHYRLPSLIIMCLFYPFILLGVLRATTSRHPLFSELISPTWLAGKRNIVLTKKV